MLSVQWPVSDPASDGTVVFQTPTGQAPKGSTIVVYIGSSVLAVPSGLLPPFRMASGASGKDSGTNEREVRTMKKILITATAAVALAFAATAAAALVPGVYDPGNTGCPTATYSNGVLHLAKNCPTPTNAAAGADITGLTGQTFTSASFTLANASECNGGSPRFDIYTTTGTLLPRLQQRHADDRTLTAPSRTRSPPRRSPRPASFRSRPGRSRRPTSFDVQGTADVSNIMVNGAPRFRRRSRGPPTTKNACKHGGWKTFNNPSFKNQGQCVAYVNHALHASKHHK